MERKALVVCMIVGFLGLLSAALGFAAEAKKIKISQVKEDSGMCSYPRSPAFGLGFTAALALLLAQIIINVSTGCICCRRLPHPSKTHWTLALICCIVSWFSFVLAFLLLLGGAALNDQHDMDTTLGYYYCYVMKPGVFAGAAALSLVCVVLGVLYYLTLTSGKSGSSQWSAGPAVPTQSGIAMGQPHIPPTSQDPVFVHEDTYIRRQFT